MDSRTHSGQVRNIAKILNIFQTKEIDLSNRVLSWALILSICVVAIVSRYIVALNSDIAWLTLAADRWLDGQKFGEDIYELNTPFSVMLYVPSVIISRFLMLPTSLVTYTLTVLVTLGCVCLSSAILKYRNYSGFEEKTTRTIFIISFLCILFTISSLAFSQRDYLVLVLLLPYALLKWAPSGFNEHPEERKKWIHVACGVMLFIGVLIKPPYMVSVFIIHLASSILYKRQWYIFPEIGVLILAALMGSACIVLFFPEWLPVAHDAWALYKGYQVGWGMTFLSLGEGVITQFFALILCYKTFPKAFHMEKKLFYALLCLAASNAVVFLMQQKGWVYQRLPVTLPLWGIVSFTIFSYIYKFKNQWLIASIAFVFFISYLMLAFFSNDFYGPKNIIYQRVWVNTARASLKLNDSFICISYSMECPFSLTSSGNYHYVSRYPSMWPTIASKEMWRRGIVNEAFFLKFLKRDIHYIHKDMDKKLPQLIVVEWEKKKDGHIEDFSDNQEFSALLTSYKLKERIDRIPEENLSTWLFVKN